MGNPNSLFQFIASGGLQDESRSSRPKHQHGETYVGVHRQNYELAPQSHCCEILHCIETVQHRHREPTLTRNTTQVTEEKPKGYHLTEDIAQDAIRWLREQNAYEPDKPFFMYWAPGAAHGPHQIFKEWADKYKGKFDDGWDAYRERTFARAKAMGWIPQNAQLTPRAATMDSWDSIPESEKPFRVRRDFGGQRATALDAEEIDQYVEKRRGEGAAPASINRTLQLLGQAFRLAIQRKRLTGAPYIRHLSEKGNVRQGFFCDAEFSL